MLGDSVEMLVLFSNKPNHCITRAFVGLMPHSGPSVEEAMLVMETGT